MWREEKDMTFIQGERQAEARRRLEVEPREPRRRPPTYVSAGPVGSDDRDDAAELLMFMRATSLARDL